MQVGDNRCLLQSLKDSPYYRSFQDKVRWLEASNLWRVFKFGLFVFEIGQFLQILKCLSGIEQDSNIVALSSQVSLWEVRLSDLDEYLLNLNAIQRRWVYLEPIFGRGALPREETRFKRVDEDFRYSVFGFGSQRLSHINFETISLGPAFFCRVTRVFVFLL